MSNPDRIEIEDSPISLWLITEASGRQYTVHRHQLASDAAQDSGVTVRALTVVPTEAAAMAATVPALNREALIDLIAEQLRGTYHCGRVWSAWSVGTMGEDDFSPVEESDTPAELADEIIAKLAPQAPVAGQPAEPSPACTCSASGPDYCERHAP